MESLAFEKRCEACSKPFNVPSLALPHHEHTPPFTAKSPHGPLITLLVGCELCLPEVRPSGRTNLTVTASVPMPEAPMNEHDRSMCRQHDVRGSGQVATVEPETIAHRVEKGPYGQLRGGVSPLDRPHVAGSLLRGEYVRHGSRHNRLRVLQEVRHVVNLEFPIWRIFLVKPLRNDERHPGLPHLLHLVR